MISIGSKAQQQILDALVAAVDAVLCPLGFELTGKGEWQRNAAWRIDEVDLVMRGGTTKRVLPSFRVLLPLAEPSQSGEKRQYVAQINIARLLHPEASPVFDVVVPSLSLGKDKFVRVVVSDIDAALPWFGQFATPEECKANLGKFLKLGCPAYLDAEKFLNSLAQH
jgi:hypothetical protein